MKWVLVAAMLSLAYSGPTSAATECKNAVDSYNSAVDEISYTMKRYGRCIEGSGGTDDCSYEFRKLKYAQDSFESAVSEYESECKR